MKKTYNQPSIKVYTIKVNNILDGSGASLSSYNEVGDKNQLGKKNGYVDDDWEDEE